VVQQKLLRGRFRKAVYFDTARASFFYASPTPMFSVVLLNTLTNGTVSSPRRRLKRIQNEKQLSSNRKYDKEIIRASETRL
jgi:hypothetical protein